MTSGQYDVVKRAVDIAVGSIALVVSAPIQLLVALLVRKQLGSPVLFRQERPGRGEKTFVLVKFRTMVAPDVESGVVGDADRVTRFGTRLRSTSLDELPTLWNVVKGDMSLVGPRPLLPQYLDRYSVAERRRHEVRPGLTGLAQVSGRNSLGWPERLALDVEYVGHRGPVLDARLLVATVGKVLWREGITAPGNATMPEFHGSSVRGTQ